MLLALNMLHVEWASMHATYMHIPCNLYAHSMQHAQTTFGMLFRHVACLCLLDVCLAQGLLCAGDMHGGMHLTCIHKPAASFRHRRQWCLKASVVNIALLPTCRSHTAYIVSATYLLQVTFQPTTMTY